MGRVRENIEENRAKGQTVKVLCPECDQETWHVVCLSLDASGDEQVEDGYEIWWRNSSQIIQCQGCEVISFRQLNTFSEEEYPADILHELRFLGNEAVHQLDRPSTKELTLAIDIIHHILDALYEIPKKAETLRDNKSRRKKKPMP
jgi:hypothetical protein